MTVEVISAAVVRDIGKRIEAARQRVSWEVTDPRETAEDPEQWQAMLESNAAEMLGALERVRIAPGQVVRYRFFGLEDGDAHLRPFVAKQGTDVEPVRNVLDWHPPPESSSPERLLPNRDHDFLYKHFEFEPTAEGFFEYWIAMQELWATAQWIHSRIVIDASHFAELIAGAEWQLEQELEMYEPVVIRDNDGAHIAVLLYCPLKRHSIALHRVRIDSDQRVTYGDPIAVATGPRGYFI